MENDAASKHARTAIRTQLPAGDDVGNADAAVAKALDKALDEALDEALDDTFPASDPVALTQTTDGND